MDVVLLYILPKQDPSITGRSFSHFGRQMVKTTSRSFGRVLRPH